MEESKHEDIVNIICQLSEVDREVCLEFIEKMVTLPPAEQEKFTQDALVHIDTLREIISDLEDGDWWKLGEECEEVQS